MILVTGITGFLGKHLVKALIKKYGRENILALTSVPTEECPYVLHNNYQFDDSIFEQLGYHESITTLIHAGAFTPKSGGEANDIINSNKNIYTTEKLFCAQLPNLENIVFLSTLDVYEDSAILSESSAINPSTLYGLSKYYSERIVENWAHSLGINHQILRIGHVYGPGEEAYKKLIPATMQKLLNNDAIEIWGDGSDLRSFIYIDDVITAILASLEVNGLGPINVVGGYPVSILEVVNKILTVSKKRADIKYLSGNSIKKDFIFDNSLMLRHLLSSETPLLLGLENEWNNLKQKLS
jgi:UDP-glucose 4-epimerase